MDGAVPPCDRCAASAGTACGGGPGRFQERVDGTCVRVDADGATPSSGREAAPSGSSVLRRLVRTCSHHGSGSKRLQAKQARGAKPEAMKFVFARRCGEIELERVLPKTSAAKSLRKPDRGCRFLGSIGAQPFMLPRRGVQCPLLNRLPSFFAESVHSSMRLGGIAHAFQRPTCGVRCPRMLRIYLRGRTGTH